MNKNELKKQIIICDTNVVVLMFLFKKSKMFDAKYTHGQIKIHPDVINQIQNWIDRNNRKCVRFGKALLQEVVHKAQSYSNGIKEPTLDQYERSVRVLRNIENKLDDSEKSMATDKVDQDLLILAYVNKAHLATQDKTMTQIGNKSLPNTGVIRFEHLVIDLIRTGALTKTDVETGLKSLDHFSECLDSKLRSKMSELCNK